MPIIVCFAGHLGAEPELRHTTRKGTAVAEVPVYVNRRQRAENESGWEDGEPTRYWIRAWRRRAEQLASLPSGAGVVVIGHVETESWVDKESGEKRYRDTVVVDELGQLFGAGTDSSGSGSSGSEE